MNQLTCSANGKQQLHWIEKKEHDQQWNWSTQRQTEGLHGIQRLDIYELKFNEG